MIATGVAALVQGLERFLLPNACLSCGRMVDSHRPDDVMCGVCRLRAVALSAGCDRCGQPLPPVGPCRFCADWGPLAWARSATWLGHETRAAVHGLKYGGYARLAGWMAEAIARRVPRPEGGVLIPVPLGARRHRTRGYNQATLIARALGAGWRLPVNERALRRLRDTASQTAFDPQARRANVRGAFAGAALPGGRADRAAILIDDVLTTGATLLAAATALSKSGWREVGAVTFARALDAGGRIAASR
jgi:predicted amidophosphoribosyltransferase